MWGKSDCLAHRLEHAELLGLAGAGDVERGPVVDGGPDHGQPDSDVDANYSAVATPETSIPDVSRSVTASGTGWPLMSAMVGAWP